MAVPLADGRRNAISWTTDRAGGFSARERNDLRNLIGPLGLVLDLLEWRRTARTLLDTYLGSGPGREVLGGAIRRGDRRDLDAVILFADLRDFTSMALTWNVDRLLQALDAYYQALVDAITVADGEVLKFVGDGLLAVFPIGKGADLEETCRRAFAATVAARQAMAAVNQARGAVGLPELDFGVALHVGRVIYGNIGGAGRLDFTVIGPAVNLVSRVEGLCKELEHSILATAAFAEHFPSDLVSIGRHVLRGFAEPVELFASPEDLAGRKRRRELSSSARRPSNYAAASLNRPPFDSLQVLRPQAGMPGDPGQPFRSSVRCEPDCRLMRQPRRRSARGPALPCRRRAAHAASNRPSSSPAGSPRSSRSARTRKASVLARAMASSRVAPHRQGRREVRESRRSSGRPPRARSQS